MKRKGITVGELIIRLGSMPLEDEVWVYDGSSQAANFSQPITDVEDVHMAHDLSCVIIEV
jgi:hypothetical protein